MDHPLGNPDKKWAGKYSTPEELEQGHSHLQSTLSERNQRIEELESQLEQQGQRMIPAGPSKDPYEQLREIAVPPEAVEAIVERKVMAAIDPIFQSFSARRAMERQYPDFSKMEDEVAGYIAGQPELKKRYQVLYQTDQLGAMEWALSKYHRSKAEDNPAQLSLEDERANARVPGGGSGSGRGADLGNAQRDKLQKAYEYGQQYGDWDPYMKLRLDSVIPDGHYKGLMDYGR